MGDRITDAVMGGLRHVPTEFVAKVLDVDGDRESRVEALAAIARINTLYMVARAGSGHLGSSFSSLDIVSWLYLEELGPEDVYFSSKGHDVPGLYAVLVALSRIPQGQMHRLRRLDGLPGHPDISTPGIAANTGSLGMGISKAKGMILGRRARSGGDWRGRVVVMTGDGELQEGQIWESLASAVTDGMRELAVVVDHNKLQSDTFVSDVSDLRDIEAKFRAWGWETRRCDGHDMSSIRQAFAPADGPLAIVADTVKGRGVSFMEATSLRSGELYRYHSGAPSQEEYADALAELRSTADVALARLGLPGVELVLGPEASAPSPAEGDDLIAAYAQALVVLAERDERVVALDADLVKDVGLLAFRDRFPERFVECGIAEQDMVSMAGGLAEAGCLPVVHSFASFLTARPHEQIYNNASEGRRIVYVGSLAGVLPAAPGHTHQAVRDLALMRGIPGIVCLQPVTAAQVARSVDWIGGTGDSVYLRLATARVPLPGAVPDEALVAGRGVVVERGTGNVVLMASSPVGLRAAWEAACDRTGQRPTVVQLPFPATVDADWLRELLAGARHVVTIDDHLLDGGVGTTIAVAIAELGLDVLLHRLGVTAIPRSGAPDEVLAVERIDARAVTELLDGLVGA